jgi:dihydrodipicolinate synthase/N-acetylneuraminate lyase
VYTRDELHGLNVMMPAFAKEGSEDLEATNTVDVDQLATAVDRIVKDGANVISTTGSYGEFHTLLDDEFQTLVRATLEVVNKRVPVFVGITSLNGREVVRKAKFVRSVGGEGIFTGVPFYYPSTVDNAIRFYHDVSELFPDLSIQIYHNPSLHRIHIPVAAFKQISQNGNIVSMKETTCRFPLEFERLMDVIRDKISVFVTQAQYFPYALMGARGFWSTSAFMGPWPLVYLRNMVESGNYDAARDVVRDLSPNAPTGAGDGEGPTDYARKLATKYAGYADLGPNRSPFVEVRPDSLERAIKQAERWKGLCEKYRPLVEAKEAAALAPA